MERIKEILISILVVGITLGSVGAGGVMWWLVSLLIKPNTEIFEILLYVFTFVPVPFCWWLTFKLITIEIDKY